MTPPEKPKFRTTVEGEGPKHVGPLPRFPTYQRCEDVPKPVADKIRELHRNWGVPSWEIAALMELPVEWVDRMIKPIDKDDP